jgi:hypothetical protein
MKIALLITLLIASSCAVQAPAPNPNRHPIGTTPQASPSAPAENSFSRDAQECEREAAISAGAGSRAQAFNECMKARGRTPQR